MNKTAGNFMKAGVIYALIGFSLGMFMAASHDFALRSVHTHLNLVGWASMAIFAFYYQLVPSHSGLTLARVHFWLANAGLILLSVSIALLSLEVRSAEPGAAAGSIMTLASLLLFAYIIFRSPRAVEKRE